MIETLLAVGLICVIFFGAMQISQLFAAREIMNHAAARGARAKTVGFNKWMVRKVVHVAAIPNSGDMINPTHENADATLRSAIESSQGEGHALAELWERVLGGELIPSSQQYVIEHARIPQYLATENHLRADVILNYEAWERDDIHYDCGSFAIMDDGSVAPNIFAEMTVWMEYTNWLSLPRTFYADDTIRLTGSNVIENHYPLYIDDQLW